MPKTVRFTAVGDIALCGATAETMSHCGMQWPFELVAPHLAEADLLFGNMEAVLIPPAFPAKKLDPKGLISKLPGPAVAAALKKANFGVLNLAANHALDAGTIGLLYTRDCLKKAGIAVAGTGATRAAARRPVFLECGGIRFCFLCYGEDTNYTLGCSSPTHAYFRLPEVLADIARYRRNADIIVVSIHADLEFTPTPSVPRLLASREIARAGADIILQHHPHVPQGIETRYGALIAYSLGNFIFDAHTFSYMKVNGPHTAHSFILKMEVSRRGVERFERIPIAILPPPEQRPHVLSGRRAREHLAYLEKLDGYLLDEEFVRKTWRAIAVKHLELYIRRAAKRLDTHGVDCVIEDIVGRLALVDENRLWMREIIEVAREKWRILSRADRRYIRLGTVLSDKVAEAGKKKARATGRF